MLQTNNTAVGSPAVVLAPEWYRRSAEEIAPLLLGKLLCRATPEGILRLRILETECYCGEEDTACQAHHGRTARCDVMYEAGGCAYVYLCYGIHHMLNVVTGTNGHPEAVLIRGVEGSIGPGRVTKRLAIDRALNRQMLTPSCGLWIEDDGLVLPYDTACRVGIDYAAREDREKLWRFIAEKS